VNKHRGPPREATLDDQIHKRGEERLWNAGCRNEVEPRGRREHLPYWCRDELGVPAARQQGADWLSSLIEYADASSPRISGSPGGGG